MAWVKQRGTSFQLRWRGPDGRELTRTYPTEEAALAAKKLLEAAETLDRVRPATVPGVQVTFSDWWRTWSPGQRWTPATRERHDRNVRRWVAPVFGRVPVDGIRAADVDRWHRTLERRGLAPKTIVLVHAALRQALEGAVRDGLIPSNPARFAKLSRAPRSPRVALTDHEADALAEAFAVKVPRLAAFYAVCLGAGLRRGEACGLTWDRVDLDRGTLTIDRQIAPQLPAGAVPSWVPTKSRKPRVVPIGAVLAAVLRDHRAAYGIGAGHLVFTDSRGGPWSRSTLAESWHRAVDHAAGLGVGVPSAARGWHVLRHTYGSRLVAGGVPVTEAAAAIGDTPEVFLSTYAHVVDPAAAHDRIRAAVDSR